MTNENKRKKRKKSSISENVTISGLDIKTSSMIIHILSALIGIFVFYFVPTLANRLGRPITAVLLNVIPNSLILAFFVVETEFQDYLEGVVWSPFLNVIANIASYIAMVYLGCSAFFALWLNVVIWLVCIILSLYYNDDVKKVQKTGKKSKNKKKRGKKSNH